MKRLTTIPLLLAPLVLGGCSGEEGEEREARAETQLSTTRPYAAELLPAIEALEAGDPTAAGRALAPFDDSRVEVLLLRARLALLDADPVRALALLEQARSIGPGDDRVYATGAELYAALGRRSASEEEVRKGWTAVGKTPALERARGILNLTVPGATLTGLASLEAAHDADPDLPFLRRPLGEAYVLASRSALGSEDPQAAHRHGVSALAFAPDSLDAREALAEAKAALFDFEGALALYGEMEAAGRDLGQEPGLLHQRAATYALLQRKDRSVAVRHYIAARERGLTDEELGFGTTVLRQETEGELDRGIERFEEGDLVGAERAFLRALELSPGDLEAQNHLAATRFRLGRYEEAAELWAAVLTEMRARDLPLVDPLPLNLARAWRNAGEPEVALRVVEVYCEREPEGSWAEDARGMAERLRKEIEDAGGG